MRIVAFIGVGVPLMENIPVHGKMEKFQSSYSECCDELVEMVVIYLNWIMYKLSYR